MTENHRTSEDSTEVQTDSNEITTRVDRADDDSEFRWVKTDDTETDPGDTVIETG